MALSLACGVARAEPTAADVESARALYVEGLELRDKGELAESLARFRAAHALAATPITALELGRAESLVGNLVEAREVLLSVERLAPSPSESEKAKHARGEAKALAEQLRARIPAVRLAFDPPQPTPPHVTIDAVEIPPEALGVPRRMNPGKHVVVAESGAARATVDVRLAEAETRTVTVVLRPAGAPPPREHVDPSPAPPPVASRDDGGGPGALFWAGAGVAGVGVVVGTITGIVALSKSSALADECTGVHCPRSAQGDLDTSRTMGTVSTVSFVVAGVGAAVAVVAWLSRPSGGHASADALRWTW